MSKDQERTGDVLEQMKTSYSSFSKGQRAIADYIIENYDKAVDMTAARLGRVVGVSESTVVRFATELGYKGYPHFQKALGEMVKKKLSSVQRISMTYERVAGGDLVASVLKTDIQNLKRTADMMDPQAFEQAVEMIGSARKIYVMGGRSCRALAQFFSFYLNYIFEDVHLVASDSISESIEEIHRISREDVIIAISFPRYSLKTLQTMAFAKSRQTRIVAITDGEQSPLARYADCCIYARSDMASFVDSLVAPLSVINAILAALSLKYKDKVMGTLETMEGIWNDLNEYEHTQD